MQFNLNISKEIIQLLSNKKLTLDQLFFLELIQKEKIDFLSKLLDTTQYKQQVINDLLNKNMIIFENDSYTLTENSVELLSLYDFISDEDSGFIAQAIETKPVVVKDKFNEQFDDSFNELWNLYPLTDKWEMSGVYGNTYIVHQHTHSRTLKSAKLKIKEKYKFYLKSKDSLKHSDIVLALKYELWFRKLNSTNVKNGLSFMQNILTWFNQRTFETYFDLYQEYISEHGSINFNDYSHRGSSVTGSLNTRLV